MLKLWLRFCALSVKKKKILCPRLEPDWDFTKVKESFDTAFINICNIMKCFIDDDNPLCLQEFDEETVKKLQAADAAAGEAREKLGYEIYHFMYASFINLRCHPRIIRDAVEFLKSRANELSVEKNIHVGEKRRQSDLASSAAEEVTSSQDTYNSNDSGNKRAKISRVVERLDGDGCLLLSSSGVNVRCEVLLSSSSSKDTFNVWFAEVSYFVIVSVVFLGAISCLTNVTFDEALRLFNGRYSIYSISISTTKKRLRETIFGVTVIVRRPPLVLQRVFIAAGPGAS